MSLLAKALASTPLLASLAAAQGPVQVVPWRVDSWQKISSTQGGLGTQLTANAYFGLSMASIGDLDGDGFRELVVGSPGANLGGTARGQVYILFLNPDGTVRAQQHIGFGTGGFSWFLDDLDYFGRGVWSLGDLDDDGVEDLIVGAYRDDDGAIDAGAVYVLRLNPDGSVKADTKIGNGRSGFTPTLQQSDLFGVRVAGIGDLNLDGVEDAVVAASFTDDGGPDHGALYVLFLNTNGTVKATQKISETAGNLGLVFEDQDLFGTSVAPIGDLDGDGVVDLAVGARGDDDGGSGRGAVYIVFLRTNGTVKATHKISDTQGGFRGGLTDFDNLGVSVVRLDRRPDGRVTIAVGSFQDDDGGTNRGAVWLLDLDRDGTVLAQHKISDLAGGFGGGLQDNDNFGTGVALLGDQDGDGKKTLAVGAWNDMDGGANGGAAWILELDAGARRGHPSDAAALGAPLSLAGPTRLAPGAPLRLSVVSPRPEAFAGSGVLLGLGGRASRPLALGGVHGALEVLPPWVFLSGEAPAWRLPERALLHGAPAAQAVGWSAGAITLSPALELGP